MATQALQEALHRFRIQAESTTLIREIPDCRAVWRVEAAGGEAYALKRFRHRRRAEKASAASRYLHAAGVAVVPSLLTQNGKLCAKHSGRYFVLFPWAPGRRPEYGEPGVMPATATLLAQFHAGSRGFAVAHAHLLSWRLDWMELMAGRVARLEAAAARAESGDDALSRRFRTHLPWLRARAAWVMEQLPRLGVAAMAEACRHNPLLSHGDYSRENLLAGPDGALTLIDLDSVTVALPVWDLSRLITWINHDLQDWSDHRAQSIVEAYSRLRPLSPAERDLLLVDQVFPHLATDIVREHFEGSRSPTLAEELERCLTTDRTKLGALGLGPR